MTEGDHIFISYARKDGRELAERLYQALRERGLSVWRDERDLNPYQDFSVVIERAIRAAHQVVVLLTPEIAQRDDSFVRREILEAQAREKPIIPLIGPAFNPKDVPILIKHLTWLPFADFDVHLPLLLERLAKPPETYTPPILPDDQYRPYLEHLRQHVVNFLDHAIIHQLDDLPAEPAPDAVVGARRDAPTPPTPRPADQFQLLFAALPMGADATVTDPPAETPITTFREGFERYNRRVLLLGEPGAGKTITLMAHARDAITARLNDPSQPLPLLGLIATWDAKEQTPLADWLASVSGGHLTEPAVQSLVDKGRALLLLDGLDELGSEREAEKTKERYDPRLRFFDQITPLPAANHILITCRTNDYAEIGAKLPLDGAICLQPLNDTLIRDYLADYPGLWTLLENDDNLREITRTPLLLSLFAFAFRDLSDAERAELHDLSDALDLRDKIFKFYVEKRYKHEAKAGKRKLAFTLEEIYFVLGEAAMFTLSDYSNGTNEIEHRLGINYEVDQKVFVHTVLHLDLLVSTDEGKLVFKHLLLRDHFALHHSLTRLDLRGEDEMHVVTHAIPCLVKLGNSSIKELINSLENPNLLRQRRAAIALGKIGSNRAVEPLITILKSPDEELRQAAAEALGKIRDRAAVPSLIAALQDTEPRVRLYTALALGNMRDERAIEPLIACLGEPIDFVWSGMIEALHTIGKPAVTSLIKAVLNDHEQIARTSLSLLKRLNRFGEDIVEVSLVGLDDADWLVRAGSCKVLGELRDIRNLEPLIRMVNTDRDARVRAFAAMALGLLKDERAVESLIISLADMDSRVRTHAAYSLGEINDSRSVKPLVSVLSDVEVEVRRGAVVALRKHGDQNSIEPLIPMLNDSDENIRLLTVLALGDMQDSRVVEPIINALYNDLASNVRSAAASRLGNLGDLRAVEPLIVALKDESNSVRGEAIISLRQLGDVRAVEPIIVLLNDNDWFVSRGAASALEELGTPEALEAVARWRAEQSGGQG